MDLNELKCLAAASLLAGSVKLEQDVPDNRCRRFYGPTAVEISAAVSTAQSIWEETLRQERED